MTFTTVAYSLAAFLTVYGFIWFYVSYTSEKQSGLFSIKNFFFLLGIFYIALSHFSVLSGLAYSVEQSNQTPCENIIRNATFVNASLTTYDYMDSCKYYNRQTPASANRLYGAYGGLIIFDALAILIGFIYIIFMWLMGGLRR